VVEILFNLMWLALSAGLIMGFWLTSRSRGNGKSPRATLCMQLIALALLIAILLPVVSLTDDLRACAAPTESEHLSRRGDSLTTHDLSLHPVAFALTRFIACQAAPQPQCMKFSAPEQEQWKPEDGHLTTAGIRPPPSVASRRA
jgi:hypothetical protein